MMIVYVQNGEIIAASDNDDKNFLPSADRFIVQGSGNYIMQDGVPTRLNTIDELEANKEKAFFIS